MENPTLLMKQFYLILALLLGSSFLFAQEDYRPTAVENAKWIIQDSETPHNPYTHFVRAVEGDTIINDTTYKKLYQYVIDYVEEQFGPRFEPPYSIFPERELIVLLRDDLETKRVYGRTTNYSLGTTDFSEDVLFHDYSLGVGDSMRGYYFSGEPEEIVIDEVGVEMKYGEMLRFQRSFSETFYEGIGSPDLGPTSGGYSFFLNCCSWRIIDYCVGTNADCSIISPVTEITRGSTITAYPNPFVDRIDLEVSGDAVTRPVQVTLRALTGQVIREARLTGSLRWSNLNLVPGVYFLTYTVDGATFTDKIVRR